MYTGKPTSQAPNTLGLKIPVATWPMSAVMTSSTMLLTSTAWESARRSRTSLVGAFMAFQCTLTSRYVATRFTLTFGFFFSDAIALGGVS